ncbi:hypothetical protein A0256_03200 [Mucilaginibacter sp. PAMC 26640]|nr:hypothetical protein A0256_03200 [Mucilaginibacter sp. PAMC 26640]
MEKHDGNIVEYVVRKNGFSITDLATAANVNRRTIYNLFRQKHLKRVFIQVVGQTIRHDFSTEFPEHFTENDFPFKNPGTKTKAFAADPADDEANAWKEKYINLLEKYTETLLSETRMKESVEM